MPWKELLSLDKTKLFKLIWVLPAAISILLVETSMDTGIAVPVPFLTIIVCVGMAGAFGGLGPGLLAGCMAAIFVVKAHLEQFGPVSLTGGVPQTAIGSALYIMIGTVLGRLKDQRDSSVKRLRDKELNLENLLQKASAEKDRQTAKVLESETRLKNAVRIAGVGHYSFNVESGDCEFCSDQHAAHFGLTPDEYRARAAGPLPGLFCIHPDDHAHVLASIDRINSGEALMFEYRALRPDGEIRYIREIEEPVFDHDGRVVEAVGASIDLTDLRQAEIRLRQSQRIEALGTLTGGVAHDFNNLLAVILGNLELSLENGQSADWPDLINEAIKATKRGGNLTKSLLSFSRRAHLEPKRLNLNQNIQNTMIWATPILPETIRIQSSLMDGLWEVELDAASVENAIINILLNARDAMPEGGTVTIKTTNMRIGEEYINQSDEDIEPGCYVMLAISDTGHGIPSDKIQAIFEPFYTDKPVGAGSGLGLSMVHGFIKQSGGAIRVYSKVGAGTTFKMFFRATGQTVMPPQPEDSERPHPKSERAEVLVVEDEADVMRVLKRILTGAGYAVKTASNGDEALKIFEISGPFDLVMTDMVMPGKLQGPALAKEIRAIDPHIPCIFLSGYASEATVHGNRFQPSDIRLMKPVSRSDLLHAVSRALNPASRKH